MTCNCRTTWMSYQTRVVSAQFMCCSQNLQGQLESVFTVLWIQDNNTTVYCYLPCRKWKKKTWSKHMLLTKNSQKITFGFLWPQLHFYTCTTGVPKFSGSVSGRWSKVCKESNKTMFLYRVEYLIDQWTQQWNKHAGIMSFQITHLAFVKMSFPFQTQRSSPQCSFIAIIKNLKKKSKHKRN